MERKKVERKIDGHDVISVELEFMAAADLVPELAAVVGPAFATEGDNASLAAAIGVMAKGLTGGKLVDLLPRLLAGTTVIVPDEADKLERLDLTSARHINRAFTGRKKLAMGAIALALEVNFADFFAAIGLRAGSAKAR